MNYYFWVRETDKHDRELAIYDAKSLKEAKKEFALDHPEDVNNVSEIYIENNFFPIE